MQDELDTLLSLPESSLDEAQRSETKAIRTEVLIEILLEKLKGSLFLVNPKELGNIRDYTCILIDRNLLSIKGSPICFHKSKHYASFRSAVMKIIEEHSFKAELMPAKDVLEAEEDLVQTFAIVTTGRMLTHRIIKRVPPVPPIAGLEWIRWRYHKQTFASVNPANKEIKEIIQFLESLITNQKES